MQQGLNGSMDLIQLLKDLVVHLTVLAVVLPKESLELLHNQKDLRAQDLILVLSDWHACFLRWIDVKVESSATRIVLLSIAKNALVLELLEQRREKLVVLLLQLVEVKKNVDVGVELVLHVPDGLSLI